MESDPQERRQFSRLHFLAYGKSKVCSVELEGMQSQADLIDISAGGARLKFQDGLTALSAKRLVLSVRGVNDNGLLQKLPASVRWRNGQELGVKFDTELDIALGTLQSLVW